MKNTILAAGVAIFIAMMTCQVQTLDLTVSEGLCRENILKQAAQYGKNAVNKGVNIDTVQKNVDEYLDKALKNTGRTYRAEVVEEKSGRSAVIPVERGKK